MATPPDILIVLDRSTSMLMGRWDPSVAAIKEFTGGLDQSVNFGLMVFPATGNDICTPGMVDVPVGETHKRLRPRSRARRRLHFRSGPRRPRLR
jgi:hypothetical protein